MLALSRLGAVSVSPLESSAALEKLSDIFQPGVRVWFVWLGELIYERISILGPHDCAPIFVSAESRVESNRHLEEPQCIF